MAIKRPIVLGTTGRKELLSSSDQLDLGALNLNGVAFVNTSGATILAGTPVFLRGNNIVLSDQTAGESTSWVQGLVTSSVEDSEDGVMQFAGVLTLTTQQWDAVVGTTGKLNENARLWLSTTQEGRLVHTLPSISGSTGKYLLVVGRAISSTSMELAISARVLL